ncbi:hypothetical protein GWN63_04260, partial [Candidatus Bathyarchaeota archaeon]|nr:hypothetical protein [Candidatus Bathyarchaeota archaeon]NIR16624.1 hypothetical protein [Desulfobacterales bacterium]NIU81443.1 hypothetical protein [Candidatus Bathyarchaeota archaeon]NIV68067.1 hypothetical protein [Candidatus Bathyarchaeota archaeon]NIW34738.1 hypothetical protein [Candidatus Bathyarchaeota archaeon]
MSLAGTCLRTVDDSGPERVGDVVEKVKAYRRRNFDEEELEDTKPPLKRLYREAGGGEAPENIGH